MFQPVKIIDLPAGYEVVGLLPFDGLPAGRVEMADQPTCREVFAEVDGRQILSHYAVEWHFKIYPESQ